MTRRGGDNVRSQSSKLLERPDASDYARSDADRVRSYFAWKLKRMTGRGGGGRDQTRWSAETRPMWRPVTDLEEDLRE
jgi:hypothetical protein